jgi:hypothetical protein
MVCSSVFELVDVFIIPPSLRLISIVLNIEMPAHLRAGSGADPPSPHLYQH